MKVFVVLSVVVALALAKPTHLVTPLVYAAPVLPVSSQYHSQDTLGQYHYGYTDHLSSKAESRSLDGVTRGAYSYVDAEGKVQSAQYVADDVHGFRISATNLPVAPAPEVHHQEKIEEPKPVEDTPEVKQAKAEHFAAVDEAKARLAVEHATHPVVAYSAPITSYPVAYSSGLYPFAYNYNYPYGYYPHNYGFHYSTFAPAYYPFVHAPVVGTPVATAPVAPGIPTDEDTVEVKAKEE